MLTPRLKTIYYHISKDKIADIGTDHGYIPIQFALDEKKHQAIATDINPGPLAMAAANIRKYRVTDQIQLRLGAGLDPIQPGEVEEIIIAGMGGEMIRKILENGNPTAKAACRLILQPMNAQYELRRWLYANGYFIHTEDLAAEGDHVYNILIAAAAQAQPPKSDIEYHLPQSLQNHPHFGVLWAKKYREFKKIRDGLLRSETKQKALILYYTDLLEQLERRKP